MAAMQSSSGPSSEPGERPRLDRPPSDRYQAAGTATEAEPGPDDAVPMPSRNDRLLRAVAVGLVGAIAITLFGGPLSITAGLVAAAGVTRLDRRPRRPPGEGRRRPDRRRFGWAGARRDLALRRDRGRRPRAGRLSRPGPGSPRPDRARHRGPARVRRELTWSPSRRSADRPSTTTTRSFAGSTTGPAAGLPATSCRACGSATSPEHRGSPTGATAARLESRSGTSSQDDPATAVLHLVAVDPRSRRRGIGRELVTRFVGRRDPARGREDPHDSLARRPPDARVSQSRRIRSPGRARSAAPVRHARRDRLRRARRRSGRARARDRGVSH